MQDGLNYNMWGGLRVTKRHSCRVQWAGNSRHLLISSTGNCSTGCSTREENMVMASMTSDYVYIHLFHKTVYSHWPDLDMNRLTLFVSQKHRA